jgi:hypothetical protein
MHRQSAARASVECGAGIPAGTRKKCEHPAKKGRLAEHEENAKLASRFSEQELSAASLRELPPE